MRTLTNSDKALIALSLANAGIKARIRKLPAGLRVVFEGSSQAVADVLNAEGFRHASGESFDRFKFDGNQAFVRYAAV